MAQDGFMPYFGQGIPLATHSQPIDTRMILEGLQNMALKIKQEQDDSTAMDDPTLQAILGGLMPGGVSGSMPNPTPPHPALVDQTMNSVRSMVNGLNGMPGMPSHQGPSLGGMSPNQGFDPSIPMQEISPGLKVGIGPVHLEGQSQGDMIPYGPPDYRDQIQRRSSLVSPAPAPSSASKRMSPEAFAKLIQILQPYSQIESTRIAASGREDTQRLKDASSLERTQVRTALGVLESMRKRDADWLIYDAKVKKIAGAGRASPQDRKDLMKAAQLAQQDASSAANMLSSETVAGLAASEPGSLAREQYDQIVKAAQAKANRAQVYQTMVDALTQAGKTGGRSVTMSKTGKIPDMSTMSEEELQRLAGG